MVKHTSSFYPPRARWYSRGFFRLGQEARRTLHLESIRLPGGLSLGALLLSLVVPGFAFFALGRRSAGWMFLAAYGTLAGIFLAALGFLAGSIAYGLLISIHAAGIVYLEDRWLKDCRFGARLALAFCTLFAVWALGYAPLTGWAERHWFMPLRLGDHVLVVNCAVAPGTLQRGDWVAYRIPDNLSAGPHEGGVYITGGLGMDRALALPGDRVSFTRQAVLVNGRSFPRAPRMPVEGELVVPEKVWFIWPSFGISGHGQVAESAISALLQQAAMVKQGQIIGRPFQHWFGRRQKP